MDIKITTPRSQNFDTSDWRLSYSQTLDQEQNSKKAPEIVFDTAEERPLSFRRIDFRRLMSLMDMGCEPVNMGNGWFVEEFDPNGLGETYPVEDSVIQQVRAFGSAWIEITGRKRTLKAGRGR